MKKVFLYLKKKFLNIIEFIKNFFKIIYYFFKEDGKKRKLKILWSNIYSFIASKKFLSIIVFALPFIIMDVTIQLTGLNVDYGSRRVLSPILFTLSYLILFVGLIFNLKKKKAVYFYIFIFFLFYILFIVNGVYYSATKNFFDFSLIELASEGSGYFLDVIKGCKWYYYLIDLVVLSFFILSFKFFPKNRSTNKNNVFNIALLFLLFNVLSRMLLGNANYELTWDTWRNPRNVYNNFNDANKCMILSGFYEYNVRDFYVTYIKREEKESETESNFLEDVFDSKNDSINKNKYTGIFKNKNVIFLQMEGIDNWLLTKEIMPNAYSLMSNSINFTNHYSFYNGGGSTFNSEFAVNVGYLTPFTYPINAYTLNKNDFPYSMANLMKKSDYSIKTFHMNSGEYYSRAINYSNWGYDRYFGLKDLGTYKKTEYYLDRELILNETFYNEMFSNDGKFINYIITYSNHLPFTSSKGVCKQLLELDYKDELEGLTSEEKKNFFDSINLTEEDCIKRQARETDYMIGLLIQALKDNDLYNNTIIVAFTDHYLYTSSDDVLSLHKDTSSNLVNKTPFFIWSNGVKKENVTKVTSQLNILPTFLNMMGVEYNEKWYVFKDVFSKNYEPITIFSDLSWYDGNVYVVDGLVTNKKKISLQNLEKKNNLVEYYIKKNDLVLKYNYFKEVRN